VRNYESQPTIEPCVDVIRRIKCVDREHGRKISWRAEKGESLSDEGKGSGEERGPPFQLGSLRGSKVVWTEFRAEPSDPSPRIGNILYRTSDQKGLAAACVYVPSHLLHRGICRHRPPSACVWVRVTMKTLVLHARQVNLIISKEMDVGSTSGKYNRIKSLRIDLDGNEIRNA